MHILWDFDGTLADAPEIWLKATRSLLNRSSYSDYDFDIIQQELSYGFPWHTPEIPPAELYNGARGGTRTLTSFRTTDFKSVASTIPPPGLRKTPQTFRVFLSYVDGLARGNHKCGRVKSRRSKVESQKVKRSKGQNVKKSKSWETSDQ